MAKRTNKAAATGQPEAADNQQMSDDTQAATGQPEAAEVLVADGGANDGNEPIIFDAATDGEDMSACCGGGAGAPAQSLQVPEQLRDVVQIDGAVLMSFGGPYTGPVTYFGEYQGWKGCPPVPVKPEDVGRLQATGVWQIYEAPEPTDPDATV